jgi:hypothetical protein
MRVLFDNGTPRGVAAALEDHVVEEARARGWDTLRNGELLDAAEAAGFEVFVTTDRNLRYQQNLTGTGPRIRLPGQPRVVGRPVGPAMPRPGGAFAGARPPSGGPTTRP